MSDEKIVVELTLEDGKYTGRMKNAGALARAFTGDINRADKATARLSKTVKGGLIPAFRDWSIIIGQSRNVLHQLWYVTGAWTQSLIKTSAEVERLTFLMKGMSDAAGETAKMQEATDNVNALFDMAKNAPFSMNALSDSFVKFKSVGIDPLDGSMKSLTNAVAAFGGTDETLHRASIAIQQMAGKGVISMEELRQQLGEAVPQAITIMAQSMGTSYGELVEEISKGTVAAEPALKAMLNGFEIVFGGKAQAMMDTYNGRIAKMKTAWTELVAQNPGISNFFESQKDLISDFTDLLSSEAVGEIATDVGNALTSVVQSGSALIQNFVLAYGKAEAFLTMLNTASLNPESFIYQLKRSFQDVIGFIIEAGKQFGKLVRDVTIWASDMTAEEYDEMMLAERIKNGAEIASDEMDDVLKMLDDTNQEISDKMTNIGNVRANMFKSFEDDLSKIAARRGDFLSIEQVEFAITRYQDMNRELKALSIQQDQLEQKKIKADATAVNVTAMGGDGGKAAAEAQAVTNALNEVTQKKGELKKQYADLQYMIANFAQTTNQSFEQVVSGQVSNFGDLKRNAQLTADDLRAIADQGQGFAALAAEQVLTVQSEIEELSGMRVSIEDIIDTDLNKKADGILDEYMEEIYDFQDDATTASADMMEQVNEIMTSGVGTHNERYAQASEIIESYYASQMESLNTILAAAQEAMIEQGEAGALAAVQLGETVMAILEALGKARDGLLGSVKTGIPTLPSKPKSNSGGGGKSKGERAMEKLKDLIKDANKESDKLAKRFADPFGYELPAAIDKARDKINKLAEDISGGKWTQEMKNLFDTMATNAMTEEMIEMAQATKDIERSLMGERDARKEIYDEEVRRIKQMKEKLIEMGIWRVEWEQTIQDQLIALQKEHEAQSPMGEFLNEWKDMYDDIEQVGVDAIKSLSQGMADMVTEGKADFADLARSAVNSLLQISFNAAMSGLGGVIQQGISGWLGGSAGASGPVGVSGSIWHTGGMVGETGRSRTVDPSMFSNAQRYHTGGVIGQEVPAILEKGEGVFTAEQMKAIGKGMNNNGGETKVNIINNTGTDVESEEASARFTPDGMIMDVVLKKVQQPGPFRDGMKRALK